MCRKIGCEGHLGRQQGPETRTKRLGSTAWLNKWKTWQMPEPVRDVERALHVWGRAVALSLEVWRYTTVELTSSGPSLAALPARCSACLGRCRQRKALPG